MIKRKLIGILAVITVILTVFALPVAAENDDTAENTAQGGLIALTFDDGPSIHTEKLLDGLKKHDAHVTFFIVGNRLDEYPELLIREYDEGHEIASHTWDHSDLVKLSPSEMAENLQKTEDKVYEILGFNIGPLNVRPPHGSVNETVEANADIPLILWNVDTGDWQSRNAEAVKEHIISHAHDGAIILLHDLYESSVDGVLAAIDELEDQGYTFVTVNELFRRKGQELTPGVTYTNAKSDGIDLGPLPEGESAQPIIEEEPEKDNNKDKEDKKSNDEEDEGYPLFLVAVCALVLIAFALGMLHTFGIITLPLPLEQMEQKRPEKRNRKR